MKKIILSFLIAMCSILPMYANEEMTKENETPVGSLIPTEGAVLYCTSHFGVYHHVQNVSPDGSTVELEDGSVWAIDTFNKRIPLSWLSSDIVVACINNDKNSKDPYRIFNNTLVQNVPCSLLSGPIQNGRLSHWIASIDGKRLALEDGSFWDMSLFDYSSVKHWEVNDSVVIGTNNLNSGFFFRLNPNILINTNKKNHSRGSCEYIKAM